MLTRKNCKQLAKSCKYDPEKIGIAILRMLGYTVKTYKYSASVYVYDKAVEAGGKILHSYDG